MMKKVFEAQHHLEAHLVSGLLRAEGIDSDVRGESLFTTVEGGTAIPGMRPSVWILDEAQLDPTLKLIESFSKGGILASAEGSPWSCPECGESHEAQFTSCWKCGRERS